MYARTGIFWPNPLEREGLHAETNAEPKRERWLSLQDFRITPDLCALSVWLCVSVGLSVCVCVRVSLRAKAEDEEEEEEDEEEEEEEQVGAKKEQNHKVRVRKMQCTSCTNFKNISENGAPFCEYSQMAQKGAPNSASL